ncbi:MAG: DUF2306 domain-containing protein, partial [Cyclobacteriaceae bacterium]
MKTFLWILFIFFAIAIGLYPFAYLLSDMKYGLLATKSAALLQNVIWSGAFKMHIFLGAVAMLTGWSQFSKKIRNKNLNLHRTLGKIYLAAVLLSGSAGLYLAFFATGGAIASFGFGGLAVSWLTTSAMAYQSIRGRDIDAHEKWMIRSYALCFAAVTLRIWLPLFQFALGMEFNAAYRIIAWLCWVPNLIVAEWIIA